MRKLAAFLVAAALFAQGPTRSRIATGLESIDPVRLRADLTFLSSDALAGRRSLERGSEVAIQWIASEFAKSGLKPLVGDSYLQPVPIIEYTVDREKSWMVLDAPPKYESYHAPDAIGNFAKDITVSGQVVFAGYGITAPPLGYDDYAGIEAGGKIVLIFNHEPQEFDDRSVFNGRGNTRYTNATYKAWNAARHGAIGVITMPDPNHPVQERGRQVTAATARIPPEALAEGGAGIPTFTISARAGEDLFAIAGKKPAEVQTAIDSKLAPASFVIPKASVQLKVALSEHKEANSYNVVGLLEGSDPALKAETIIYSGHFDHNGIGPQGVFHGADDNGSGTVGVVELARAFAMNPVKPRRSILFVVFAGEERGLLGAYYYVSRPLRPLETTRAQINFDMIGRDEAADPRVQTEIDPDTSNELGLIGTHYSPDYRAVVERANQMVGLKLTYKWDRDAWNSVLFRSDQYPFLQRDIPAIWWFTGFHPDYHQVSDTADKINYAKMTKILKLAYLSGFEFADSANVPKIVGKAMAR
jgi:hypothetical protein